MRTFDELQEGLGRALAANLPGSRTPHVVVLLPSYSLGESLFSHYALRIPALEHRYLLAQLMLGRIDSCHMVFIASSAPSRSVVDYYTSLLPADRQASAAARLHVVTVPDATSRPVAAKLLDRPDLLDQIRELVGDRVGFIEPWNVTADEVEVARRLALPVNGTAPALWPVGYKSSGRRLLSEAGVPIPVGRDDVRTVDDVVAGALDVLARSPGASGVVVKLDDSGAGDGNLLLRLGAWTSARTLRSQVESFPDWYLRALRSGGVVEELVTGTRFSSPSVQVDITPDGSVTVLATHEQVLGGESGQVYLGCAFPADAAYAAQLGRYGRAIGEVLRRRGAIGRFSVDFAAACDRQGRWSVYALEVNLRKGGTTHPYCALRNLAPGRYDVDSAAWLTGDGSPRCYSSSDNLLDPRWLGTPPSEVIAAVRGAGLGFDSETGTGVVLHMLSGLAIDGRFGATAIARDPARAAEMLEETSAAVTAPLVAGTAR